MSPDRLAGVATSLLVALGTPEDLADTVSSSLVEAQLAGHDSHGVIRLVEYASFVERGAVRPAARASVSSRLGGLAMVDGQWGWGQPACRLAVETVYPLARANGVGLVTVAHCNHVGRVGEYVERLAQCGLVALCWCNADPSVAPYGGIDRLLGTNPFASAFPLADGEPPAVVDFATAAVAEGKLRVARATGASIAPGLVIDAQGQPAQDPEAYYAGGSLLPFGAHKGYALSVMIEVLGGALSGNHTSSWPEYTAGNGVVLIAIDPEACGGLAAFQAESAQFADTLRHARPADAGSPVLVPGDVENATRRARADGLSVPTEVWDQLRALGERIGVPVD